MGAWYVIGLFVGLGTSIGVALTAAFRQAVAGALAAAAITIAIALVFSHWYEAVGGVVGSACGALGSWPIVAGALRRGGTRAGTALLLAGTALVGAALAFVPVVGYLEALVPPALGRRARRRAPDRHAGLRSLARD